MMDYQEFVTTPKALLVAPAGYGKTHTIAECLKYTDGKQLILTHTHAGVASIKEKLKKMEINRNNFEVETITGFAQKYVLGFGDHQDLPEQKAKDYFPKIIVKAEKIFENQTVKYVLKNSYSGLFVDEYQDCTKSQHNLILLLSNVLFTRILGDPLQAIFGFGEPLVNFETDLQAFTKFPELSEPKRWQIDGNNAELGQHIKSFRKGLLERGQLKLISDDENGLVIIKTSEDDIYSALNTRGNSQYARKLISYVSNRENIDAYSKLLIIAPSFFDHKLSRPKGGKNDRETLVKRFGELGTTVNLLEAIDEATYYTTAKKVDELTVKIAKLNANKEKLIHSFLDGFFQKTALQAWIKETGVASKKMALDDKLLLEELRSIYNLLLRDPSIANLNHLIVFLAKQLKLNPKHRMLTRYVMRAIENASMNANSVEQEMIDQRNRVRRTGRKVDGKNIGTTLLTKGLEFDTVIILDAHKFVCPKNLYVALSRACKYLVIFSRENVLQPLK